MKGNQHHCNFLLNEAVFFYVIVLNKGIKRRVFQVVFHKSLSRPRCFCKVVLLQEMGGRNSYSFLFHIIFFLYIFFLYLVKSGDKSSYSKSTK